MIVLGVPREVKSFFSKTTANCSRPIRHALAPMVLAFLLAPHRRCLKTIAGEVLAASLPRGHDLSPAASILNGGRGTGTSALYDDLLDDVNAWERRQAKGKRRQWIVAIDTTYHSTMSEQMENLIVMSKRRDPRRKTTRQHAFLMGLVLTDRGARLPLPRKSYYTEDYCRKHRRRFRTTMRTGGGHDPRTARAGRRGRGRGVRQRLRRRGDPPGVPETRFSRGFSARSESGPGPHAGAGRGVAVREKKWLPGRGSWSRKRVCPAGARDGQRRPRLRPSATRRQLASQENEAAVCRRGAPSDGLQTGRLPDRGVVQGKPEGATLAGPIGRVVGVPSSAPVSYRQRRRPQAVALASARCWPAPIRRRPLAKWSSGTKSVGKWNCSSGS